MNRRRRGLPGSRRGGTLAVAFLLAFALLGGTDPLAGQDPDSALSVADSVEAAGQAPDSVGAQPDGPAAPIVLGRDTLGFLYGNTGLESASQRAATLNQTLVRLRLGGVPPDSVGTDLTRDPPVVLASGRAIMAVTPADARGLGLQVPEAAQAYADLVRGALAIPLIRATPRQLLISTGLVILTTVLLLLAFKLLGMLQPKVAGWLTQRITKRISSVKVQDLELVSTEQIDRAVRLIVGLMRVLASLALIAAYLPLVFSFFPATRHVANLLLSMILNPLRSAGMGILRYLPNLLNIAVIVAITYYGLGLVKLVFEAVGKKRIRIRGFYSDWARPTYQLIRIFIVVFAVVLIWPYLPNSDSRAFQGVAAFLGLLLTFGSASAVSNAVGGVVMVYMRPFQEGDRVRIGETMGDVVQGGILVTRIRTPKNVVITIPNSQVLGSHIVNYSRVARNTGLVLHTSVTIGYDVPWPRVHEALLAAAKEVDGVVDDRDPFVLQTALDDFTVRYELNVHTREPKKMQAIYSDLHRNIQDEFARSGIEITSPTFHAIRDGNASTIPALKPRARDEAMAAVPEEDEISVEDLHDDEHLPPDPEEEDSAASDESDDSNP